MKPLAGLVIDGPAAGQVITVQRSHHIVYVCPDQPFQPATDDVVVEPVVYTAHRFRIGPRLYTLLSIYSTTALVDFDAALLALIDADPQDARRCCEVKP